MSVTDEHRPLLLRYGSVAPRVAADAIVAPGATLVGDVEVGAGAAIGVGCVLRADVNKIRIGAGSRLHDGVVVHVSPGDFPTLVGINAVVGPLALLHGCRLEDGACVGACATVLNGGVVEGDAVVAAGAFVTAHTRVPRGEVWGGTPARHLRPLRRGEMARLRAAGGITA